jgi:hypothetical protein
MVPLRQVGHCKLLKPQKSVTSSALTNEIKHLPLKIDLDEKHGTTYGTTIGETRLG